MSSLAFPALQWAAIWSFHPETLAAGFLGLAVLAADRQRWRPMAVWLGLALLCKEDVGLVLAGFGALLWTTGHSRVGRRTLAAGLGWFLLAAFVLIPLTNRRPSPHLELNYGITGSGPTVLLEAVPTVAGNGWQNVVHGQGDTYLLLSSSPPSWDCRCWIRGGCCRPPRRSCSIWPPPTATSRRQLYASGAAPSTVPPWRREVRPRCRQPATSLLGGGFPLGSGV